MSKKAPPKWLSAGSGEDSPAETAKKEAITKPKEALKALMASKLKGEKLKKERGY